MGDAAAPMAALSNHVRAVSQKAPLVRDASCADAAAKAACNTAAPPGPLPFAAAGYAVVLEPPYTLLFRRFPGSGLVLELAPAPGGPEGVLDSDAEAAEIAASNAFSTSAMCCCWLGLVSLLGTAEAVAAGSRPAGIAVEEFAAALLTAVGGGGQTAATNSLRVSLAHPLAVMASLLRRDFVSVPVAMAPGIPPAVSSGWLAKEIARRIL